MSGIEEERERKEGEPYQVVISDLRHSRDVEEEELEPEASEAETPESPAVPDPAPAAVAPAPEPAAAQAGPPPGGEVFELEEGDAPDYGPEDMAPDDVSAGEMAYLRQVFAAGLPAYLRSQLGLLLNFALLALGRAPDPATGLVSKNLPHARLAIDVLEFIVLRLDPELQAPERAQMKALLSDLKYAYMQAVGPAVPPGAAGPAAG